MSKRKHIIGIVGPSKSGKSTLKKGLEQNGFTAKHIAQEHSFAPNMWRQIANPDLLIYLDVSFQETLTRGQPTWSESDYERECARLKEARNQADLYVHTNDLTSAQILKKILDFVNKKG